MKMRIVMKSFLVKNLEKKLISKFSPEFLEIIDESHKHAGHSGVSKSEDTHFKITITSSSFINLSKLERHRMVYSAIGKEMVSIHAVSLAIFTPEEKKER
jgi:BolA protein